MNTLHAIFFILPLYNHLWGCIMPYLIKFVPKGVHFVQCTTVQLFGRVAVLETHTLILGGAIIVV